LILPSPSEAYHYVQHKMKVLNSWQVLINFLKLPKHVCDLKSLVSLAHITGPKDLIECLAEVTVLNRGIIKSEFLKLWPLSCWNKSDIYVGQILYLTLYIKMAISWSLRLYNVVSFSLAKRCS
jgi:hypothetical protein